MRTAPRRGLFSFLFGRRRKGTFDASLSSVLAGLLETDLSRRTGKRVPLVAMGIEHDALAREIDSFGPAWVVVYFRDANVPDLVLLTREIPSPDCFTAISDPPWTPYHVYAKRYSARDAKDLIWRASACVCQRIAPADSEAAAAYACVREQAVARIEKSLEDDALRDTLKAVFAGTDTPPRREPSLAARAGIEAPWEFALGRLFLPVSAPCGAHVALCRILSVSPRAANPTTPGIWASFTCGMERAKIPAWTVWFFFPGTARDTGKAAQTMKAIVEYLCRAVIREMTDVLGSGPERPRAALCAPPDSSAHASYVMLQAEIVLGPNRIPCEVRFGYQLLAALLRAFVDPTEIASSPQGATAILPLLFSLSHSLFRKWLERQTTEDAQALTVAALLSMASQRDRALVVQNFLLPQSGLAGIGRVFCYRQQTGKGTGIVAITNAADLDAILSLLPDRARQDWREGRIDASLTREDCLRANRDAFEGLHAALRKKSLGASPRLGMALEKLYLGPAREQARRALEAVTREGVPFRVLHGMPRPLLQRCLASEKTKTLCLALFGADNEIGFITGNVGRNRRAQLTEDVRAALEQFRSGEIEASEIVAAKREVERAARAMVEKAAKTQV